MYTKHYGVNCFSSSTTSTSFELPSSHARLTLIKFTKQQWVSELVSQLVTDKHNQWSDSGPIKIPMVKEACSKYAGVIFTDTFHSLNHMRQDDDAVARQVPIYPGSINTCLWNEVNPILQSMPSSANQMLWWILGTFQMLPQACVSWL